jgi:hypothetical protein
MVKDEGREKGKKEGWSRMKNGRKERRRMGRDEGQEKETKEGKIVKDEGRKKGKEEA